MFNLLESKDEDNISFGEVIVLSFGCSFVFSSNYYKNIIFQVCRGRMSIQLLRETGPLEVFLLHPGPS